MMKFLAATVNELKELTAAEGYKVDCYQSGEVEKNINKIIDNWTRVDILVNNAGITRDGLILRMSESDWDKVIAVNLKARLTARKRYQIYG